MRSRPKPRSGLGLALLLGAGACGAAGAKHGGTSTTSPPSGAGADASVIVVAGGSSDAAATLPDAAPDTDGALDPGDAGIAPPYFGGNVEDGGVVFRVWAPHATQAWVRGDFASSDVPMDALDGGVFAAHVGAAHAGSSYALVLQGPSGTLTRTDPYCRELGGALGCLVVDPFAYPWTAPVTRPARRDAVVYELHVGSFAVPSGAAQGTFASTRDALQGLADLGVNVVELMPVQSFGGGPEGWGYNPQLYFAPKASYGSLDDLRSLVDRAHALGIAVWIDTVVNHTDGWSEAPLACFDGDCPDGSAGLYYFPPGTYATTPWGPRPDYPDPNVAGMLEDAVDAWMGELRADGFRWDSTSNIRAIDGNGTTPGGRDLLVGANARVHARGGLSVAEDLKGYAAITESAATGGFGFDAQWDGFGYTIDGQLTVAADGSRDLGAVVSALQGSYGGDPFARVLFTEDHDTVGNGGSRLPDQIDPANPTSFAARKRSMLGAALLFTAPGVPMIFMGQEALATGGFADPPPPLPAPSSAGLLVRAYYKELVRLRRNLDGASGGLSDDAVDVVHRDDTAKVLGYLRHGASGEDVLVVVNLQNKAYPEYDVGVADSSSWRIRVNDDLPAYGADFTGTQAGTLAPVAHPTDGDPYALPLQLGAYSVMILTR